MGRIGAALALALPLASCGASHVVTVEVISEPEGARIIRDGEFLGESPLTFAVPIAWLWALERHETKYITLEAIPSAELAARAAVSGTVQRRTISLSEPRDAPFRVFFDMGLERGADVKADIDLDIN